MATEHPHDLNDSQWAALNRLIPEPSRRKHGRGRPWKNRRFVLNAILWVFAYWFPLGRSVRSLPAISNVSSEVSAMGTVENTKGSAGGISRGLADTGST
jgi:hypothetical protein